MHANYRDDKNDVPKKLPTPLVHDPSLPDSLRANRDLQRNRKGVIEAVHDLFGVSLARPNDDLVEAHLSVGSPTERRPKHGDCLGRFSLGPTIPLPGACHTARLRGRLPYRHRHPIETFAHDLWAQFLHGLTHAPTRSPRRFATCPA